MKMITLISLIQGAQDESCICLFSNIRNNDRPLTLKYNPLRNFIVLSKRLDREPLQYVNFFKW